MSLSRQCWFYFLKRAFFSSGSFVVYLWRQRSSDQDDHKGKKHHNETSFQNHRVALDWLFDRISLDSKIQIKYIDTKNQLADMLTKGSCTRDEWNHLLCLFNISISVPPIVLKWCRKERKKNQVKKESQQNRSRWWICARDTAQGIQTCLPRLHQKAQGKPDMKVKYLWAHGLSSILERGDLLRTLARQTTQN